MTNVRDTRTPFSWLRIGEEAAADCKVVVYCGFINLMLFIIIKFIIFKVTSLTHFVLNHFTCKLIHIT